MDDSSILQDTLEAIDSAIAIRKADIELGQALIRLKNNSDFKTVILDGYVETEAQELFNILTDPSGASPYSAERIKLKLEAISHFKGYIGTDDFKGTIEVNAEQAPQAIAREEEYRREVTASCAGSGE